MPQNPIVDTTTTTRQSAREDLEALNQAGHEGSQRLTSARVTYGMTPVMVVGRRAARPDRGEPSFTPTAYLFEELECNAAKSNGRSALDVLVVQSTATEEQTQQAGRRTRSHAGGLRFGRRFACPDVGLPRRRGHALRVHDAIAVQGAPRRRGQPRARAAAARARQGSDRGRAISGRARACGAQGARGRARGARLTALDGAESQRRVAGARARGVERVQRARG